MRPDGPLSQAGTHRKQGHLYSIVSDATTSHRSTCALNSPSSMSRTDDGVGPLVAALVFRRVVAYLMLGQRQVVMVHAGCVSRTARE